MNVRHPITRSATLLTVLTVAATAFAQGDNSLQQQVGVALAGRPLEFVENRGQFDERALFRVDGDSLGLFVTQDGFNVSMRGQDATHGANVFVTFEGAGVPTSVITSQPNVTERNWLVGPRENWVSGVRSFGEVTLVDVYPGIDVRFYASGSSLEYDFVLAPGADASQIVVRVDGADSLEVAADGSLVAQTAAGPLMQHIPATYVISQSGARHDVACRARLIDERRFAFDVEGRAAHDRLVIDPVLTASALLCGNYDDEINAVAVGWDGSVFVAGTTESFLFPTTQDAWDRVPGGTEDAFAAKLSPDLKQVVWCTYLGADAKDQGNGIAVNSYGEACIVGRIEAGAGPTAWVGWPGNSSQIVSGSEDAFVAHLYIDGKHLYRGGLLAGSDDDKATCVRWINQTTFAVAGTTSSLDFLNNPTGYGHDDIFAVRIDEDFPLDLTHRRVIGGNNDDEVQSMVTRNGKLYIAGVTNSPNMVSVAMPSGAVGYDLTHNNFNDGFVIALEANLTTQWFTYLGGSDDDEAVGVDIDSYDHVFVAGESRSGDFPKTLGSYTSPTLLGNTDVFLTRLDTNGTQLGFSFLFGAGAKDNCGGLVVDYTGFPWVAGHTKSTNFPTTTNAWSTAALGGSDVFAARFTPDGKSLEFSTYLGGTDDEDCNAIARVTARTVVVAGATESSNYPRTTEGTPSFLDSGSNGFISKLESPVCTNVKAEFSYGTSTKGWQTVAPKLTYKNFAQFNAGFNLVDITQGATGYLAVGTSSASMPYQGGTMLVASPWLFPLGEFKNTSALVKFSPTQYGSITCGLTLYYQVLLYPGASQSGTPAMTNGVWVTFGN